METIIKYLMEAKTVHSEIFKDFTDITQNAYMDSVVNIAKMLQIEQISNALRKEKENDKEKESNKERETVKETRKEHHQIQTSKQLTSNSKQLTVTTIQDIGDRSSMYEMTDDEIYKISNDLHVSFPSVKNIANELRERALGGDLKNPCKNYKLTVRNWVRNAIKWGQVDQLDPISQEINTRTYSPEAKKRWELAEKQAEDGGLI